MRATTNPRRRAIISSDDDNSHHILPVSRIRANYYNGRLKDIIVTSTGEKVPPADMEAAILRDPSFEQSCQPGAECSI